MINGIITLHRGISVLYKVIVQQLKTLSYDNVDTERSAAAATRAMADGLQSLRADIHRGGLRHSPFSLRLEEEAVSCFEGVGKPTRRAHRGRFYTP